MSELAKEVQKWINQVGYLYRWNPDNIPFNHIKKLLAENTALQREVERLQGTVYGCHTCGHQMQALEGEPDA